MMTLPEEAVRSNRQRVGMPRGGAPHRPGDRPRILPRSVLGIVALVVAGAVGLAFGGTIVYAYYQFDSDRMDKVVDRFASGFDDRYHTAITRLDTARDQAKSQVHQELAPLEKLRASPETLKALIDKVNGAIYLIETQDDFGRPRVARPSWSPPTRTAPTW
jgi:hypothetical protein